MGVTVLSTGGRAGNASCRQAAASPAALSSDYSASLTQPVRRGKALGGSSCINLGAVWQSATGAGPNSPLLFHAFLKDSFLCIFRSAGPSYMLLKHKVLHSEGPVQQNFLHMPQASLAIHKGNLEHEQCSVRRYWTAAFVFSDTCRSYSDNTYWEAKDSS